MTEPLNSLAPFSSAFGSLGPLSARGDITSNMDPATLLRNAKAIAVPLPFILAGYSYAFSQNAVPGVLDHPATFNTPVFARVFNAGALIIVPGSLLSAATSGYLAYIIPAQRQIWGVAAAASIAPLVWTALIMNSGIKRLIAISEDKAKQEKATANLEHRQLLSKWITQNYMRAGFFFVAGVAAMRATAA
ncbi:hypothetical protein LTS10_010042 [Elasticomyces elasticus]|nr:hypothetical protein LTS10_010042 [Elasticomyces elasticus]